MVCSPEAVSVAVPVWPEPPSSVRSTSASPPAPPPAAAPLVPPLSSPPPQPASTSAASRAALAGLLRTHRRLVGALRGLVVGERGRRVDVAERPVLRRHLLPAGRRDAEALRE